MRSYALAGASARSLDYVTLLNEQYASSTRIVGVFDPNPVRASYVSHRCGDAPIFDRFRVMLEETKPDCVLITTVDRYHHVYAIGAMEAGCDVICEKPVTIDAEKCRAILAAEEQTGKSIAVTFNYRYTPLATRIKQLLREGCVGRILQVDFEWFLDTTHGADYFRRWHRRMENSGGLLVHKATHHFDVLNWWLEDWPESVFALGDLRFYGPTREERGVRCSTCEHKSTCEFYVDFASNPLYAALYYDGEYEDGYHRDGCVFSPEVDILDNMSVSARYQGGTLLSYTLNAYSPYEGWRAAINGTEGRMEIQEFLRGAPSQTDHNLIRLFNHRDGVTTVRVPKEQGEHGGGDARLVKHLFAPHPLPDPLGHRADSRAAAMSTLIGVAANQSIMNGELVNIQHLLTADWG